MIRQGIYDDKMSNYIGSFEIKVIIIMMVLQVVSFVSQILRNLVVYVLGKYVPLKIKPL